MASQKYLTIRNDDPYYQVVKGQAPAWNLTTVTNNLNSLHTEAKANKFQYDKLFRNEFCLTLAQEILELMPTVSGVKYTREWDWFFNDPQWLVYFVSNELTESLVWKIHNDFDELPPATSQDVANLRTTGLLIPDLLTSLVSSSSTDYKSAIYLLRNLNFQEVKALLWRMTEAALPEKKRKQAAGLQKVKEDKEYQESSQWVAETSDDVIVDLSKEYGFDEAPSLVGS